MKKTFAVCLLSFGALSACTPISVGSAGEMSDGSPVSATITVDNMNSVAEVRLLSPQGWTCTSGKVDFLPAGQKQAYRQMPLTCSNGAKGNLILTLDQFADQASGTFSLSNGKSGSVTFG